jgi:peroxiredoxin
MAKIGVGDTAPVFSLESVNRGTVSLSDYRNGKLVIIFGRYFGCPVCQYDFDELMAKVNLVREKAEFIFFTQSSSESARKYLRDYEGDFPVVSVPKEDGRYKVYDDYSVGNMGIGITIEILRRASVAKKAGKIHGDYEGRETQCPADFVVDEVGKIIWAHRGVLDLEKLLDFLNGF